MKSCCKLIVFSKLSFYPVLFLLFSACQSSSVAPDYYFPLPGIGEAYVYQYTSETKGFPDEYWHIGRTGSRQLRICIYDEFRGWNQCSFEYLAPSGVLQDSILLFSKEGKVNRVEIVYGNLYPREAPESEQVFLQYLRWYNDPDSITYTEVIRNRRLYISSEISENELAFQLLESIEDFQEGYLAIEAHGKEIFRRGVGLVYFTKELGGEVSRTYNFAGEISVEDLERKIGSEIPEF